MSQKPNWTTLKEEIIFENQYFRLKQDQVIRPDNKNGEYCFIQKQPFVVIVPFDAEGKVIWIRLFRYPKGKYVWEVPAGGIEQGEEPLEAAKRELKEEISMQGEYWEGIGQETVFESLTDQYGYIFIAKNLTKCEGGNPEEEGIVEVRHLTVAESLEMIKNEEIRSSFAITAFFKALLAEGKI
jgi:8-oxo-dGTP pyrophosphatase MutT (NUDIX family)